MAEQIKSWTSWEPTVELRWLVSGPAGDPSSLPPKLQQRWECVGSNDPDKIGDDEWRDVPSVDYQGRQWP